LVLATCWRTDRVLGHRLSAEASTDGGDGGRSPGYVAGETAGGERAAAGAAASGGNPVKGGTGGTGSVLGPPEFGPATLFAELSLDGAEAQDPTLTADGLELAFSSDRSGNNDIWSAKRASITDPWLQLELVEELSSAAAEGSPHLSGDGLQIWFASKRAGGLGLQDIWTAVRRTRADAWSTPTVVPALSSAGNDIGPCAQGDWFALASDRDGAGYDLYLADRADPAAPWGAPAVLGSLSTALSEWDPFLTADAHQLLWAANVGTSVDLMWAARANTADTFEVSTPLASLNTEFAEHDPWWSESLGLVVFASNRGGTTALYQALELAKP
jgi:hypothetical protein